MRNCISWKYNKTHIKVLFLLKKIKRKATKKSHFNLSLKYKPEIVMAKRQERPHQEKKTLIQWILSILVCARLWTGTKCASAEVWTCAYTMVSSRKNKSCCILPPQCLAHFHIKININQHSDFEDILNYYPNCRFGIV